MGSQPPLSPPLPVYLRSTPTRKPHPILPPDGQDNAVMHGGPVSPVRIDAAIPQPQPSSAEMGHMMMEGQIESNHINNNIQDGGRPDGQAGGQDERRESDESIEEPYQPL
ncbi:hypothetical protein FQN49_008774, partial [Arthroderma sp. PD_2]